MGLGGDGVGSGGGDGVRSGGWRSYYMTFLYSSSSFGPRASTRRGHSLEFLPDLPLSKEQELGKMPHLKPVF